MSENESKRGRTLIKRTPHLPSFEHSFDSLGGGHHIVVAVSIPINRLLVPLSLDSIFLAIGMSPVADWDKERRSLVSSHE